jgi:hypothetical protein
MSGTKYTYKKARNISLVAQVAFPEAHEWFSRGKHLTAITKRMLDADDYVGGILGVMKYCYWLTGTVKEESEAMEMYEKLGKSIDEITENSLDALTSFSMGYSSMIGMVNRDLGEAKHEEVDRRIRKTIMDMRDHLDDICIDVQMIVSAVEVVIGFIESHGSDWSGAMLEDSSIGNLVHRVDYATGQIKKLVSGREIPDEYRQKIAEMVFEIDSLSQSEMMREFSENLAKAKLLVNLGEINIDGAERLRDAVDSVLNKDVWIREIDGFLSAAVGPENSCIESDALSGDTPFSHLQKHKNGNLFGNN